MAATNAWCEALGIPVPRFEVVKASPDANYYSLLIVVLLERGAPVTLRQAADRLEEAGVVPAASALQSLKRCKPGRAPIYRDGEYYSLDPHDDETGLWAFRLGLRPARAASTPTLRLTPPPLPELDRSLSAALLVEAWHEGHSLPWSAQRVAICVLDAHGGAMRPADAIAFVKERMGSTHLSVDSSRYWRAGAPVREHPDGMWRIDPDHQAVRAARAAIRDRLDVLRRNAHLRSDPAVIAATRERLDRERTANAELLANMRRVILHVFPFRRPQALVLLDVGLRTVRTLVDDELARVHELLQPFEMIVGVQVRELLRVLGFAHGDRRLGELGPPQKTMAIDRRGRTLKITQSLLVRGTCGIGRPFGDTHVLKGYLKAGEHTTLRRRLEADAKSLYSLYEYGRLHGCVRLRWGSLDERVPVPWVHRDELRLYKLLRQAFEDGAPLEVVVGNAPGWESPWARAESVRVVRGQAAWDLRLVDDDGQEIDRADVQLIRPKLG